MLRITILCVGKLKEKYLRDAVGEYSKRLGAFCKLNIVELGEEKTPEKASPAQIAHTIEAEGERILAKIPNGAKVIVLCIEGKQLSSEQLGDEIARIQVDGDSHIVFIIGGSWGLSDKVKNKASVKLSMSKMTFPHQLARVMLLEQVYRAFQIITGGKYHK